MLRKQRQGFKFTLACGAARQCSLVTTTQTLVAVGMAAASSAVGGVRRPRSGSSDSNSSSAKRPRSSGLLASRDLDSEKKRITITECHKLALAGNPQAQWRLANAFFYGQGGKPVDIAKSIVYYRLAADAGYPKAVHDMACFYADGHDDFIEVDKAKAVKLWTQAANAGELACVRYLNRRGWSCTCAFCVQAVWMP